MFNNPLVSSDVDLDPNKSISFGRIRNHYLDPGQSPVQGSLQCQKLFLKGQSNEIFAYEFFRNGFLPRHYTRLIEGFPILASNSKTNSRFFTDSPLSFIKEIRYSRIVYCGELLLPASFIARSLC
jgi:hypothetical protein